MNKTGFWNRIMSGFMKAWAITAKDLRVYYFNPPMIMFGFLLPVLLFFSFSVRRGAQMTAEVGIINLISMILFFTASTAGPVVLVMERRTHTLDRLMTAPISMFSLLSGKMLVGVVFAVAVALIPFAIGMLVLNVDIQNPVLLGAVIVLSAMSFSALGIWFGSFPVRSVGSVMMPSTLLRWPLLFISGIFIPIKSMPAWARIISYISPLTYAHDAVEYSIRGTAVQPIALDILLLPASMMLFLLFAIRLYRRVRKLGY